MRSNFLDHLDSEALLDKLQTMELKFIQHFYGYFCGKVIHGKGGVIA